MHPFFQYMLQVNIALLVFFILYRAVLKRDTFLQLRRFFFLTVILFSLSYPFLSIPLPAFLSNLVSTGALPTQATVWVEEPAITAMPLEVSNSPHPLSWQKVFVVLYVAGLLVFSLRFVAQLISILRIRSKCKRVQICGIWVNDLEEELTPFSFFRQIYIHIQKHSDEELKQILLHELAHSRQMHSADIVLAELLTILFWWNPIVWFMKHDMVMNLEYLADYGVLTQGVDSRDYQYHLLRLTYQQTAVPIVNNFNVSQLKQRIMMMNQSKSPGSSIGRYLLMLPLALLFLAVNSLYGARHEVEEEAVINEQSLQEPPPEKQEEEIFITVDEMPEFPGGQLAMMKFLGDSIRYPEEAHKKGIQGRVICNFIVKSDGSTSDYKIVRGVDPLLDNEALRVLKLMPKWKPGMKDDKPVDVRFTLPLTFSLAKSEPNDAQMLTTQKVTENFEPAVFPGGEKEYFRFFSERIKYPVIALENGIQGFVEGVYNIDTKGKATFVRISRGVDPSLDKEVQRLIELMPHWTPAKLNGEPTSITTTVSVVFRLEGVETPRGANEVKIPDDAIVVVGYPSKK